ncbi:MAG TPA: hypothetical protein VF862_05575, partial [Gemmatimonadales bacterium]
PRARGPPVIPTPTSAARLILGAAVIGCLSPATSAAQKPAASVIEVLSAGRLSDSALRESSGVARSHLIPGVLYSINDSGTDAEIFALDSTGAALGRWALPALANHDWEAIAAGPCPAGRCLYIGDLGDNLEKRKHVTIYRLAEPGTLAALRNPAGRGTAAVDSLRFRYPDGPRDAEALWLDPSGVPHVVSKGRSGKIILYRVPPRFGRKPIQTAERVEVLPISAQPALGQWVTDAALAPDGRRVAIRTYTMLYLFPVLSDGRLGAPARCGLAGLEPQGEGVEWLDDRRLFLTSESRDGKPAPIHVVRCGAN